MIRISNKWSGWLAALLLFVVYALTAPSNHSEAEDVYDYALRVEQGGFPEQADVNRILALPVFGAAYKTAQALGYHGRAFPFMIFINRLLAVVCVFLFWKLLGKAAPSLSRGCDEAHPSKSQGLVPNALLLAFSYGFWRYANEAEVYVLAMFVVLSAWYLALDVKRRWYWIVGALVSGLGVLIHLLNLVPLLIAIPCYYLFSKAWKKALLHGGIASLVVIVGYALSSSQLDFGSLGAQHHAEEAGFRISALLKGGVALGQCLLGGNFLFGFEPFRTLLAEVFPSRMFGEEFFMASHMGGWIQWGGSLTLLLVVAGILSSTRFRPVQRNNKPLFWAACVWLVFHVAAVVRTESGSPELWIPALVPFWLVAFPLLKSSRMTWLLSTLFLHNLVGGLMPVMSKATDYHAAQGKWIVENCTENDQVLTSYEPIMIFYLNYFSEAEVVSSGDVPLDVINDKLGTSQGESYALDSLFEPLTSMQARYPFLYERMLKTGEALRPRFARVEENEFGGIYQLRKAEQ